MSYFKKIILIFFLFGSIYSSKFLEENPIHKYTYNPFPTNSNLYKFSWTINAEKKIISITLDVEATGWISFGISKYGFMNNSHVIIGYVNDDGSVILEDYFIDGYKLPEKHSYRKADHFHLSNITGYKTDTRMIISFDRILEIKEAGAVHDFNIVYDKEQYVIFAYKNGSHTFSRHDNQINANLILFPKDNESPIWQDFSYRDDPNILTMNVRVENLQISTHKNSHHLCKMYNINEILSKATGLSKDTAYHMIAYEPFYKNTVDVIHHMLVVSCVIKDKDFREGYFYCLNMPNGCIAPVMMQALGSGPMIFPKNAGLIWGTDTTKYILIQMHMELQEEQVNSDIQIVDSSGFKVYFTNVLRKHNAAISILGKTATKASIDIAPGQKNFVITDTCDKKCTQKLFSDGINLFAYNLHGHWLMTDIRHKIYYKSGLNDVNTLSYFGFNVKKQVFVPLRKEIRFSPGDELKLQCYYDSTGKTEHVIGGLKSENEMCNSYWLYYPAYEGNGFRACSLEGNICLGHKNINNEIVNRADIKLIRSELKWDKVFDPNYDPELIYTGERYEEKK